ncbi:thioesterase [Bordetella pertussis]|nr:thioesterase [Bordetella pertussis]
MTDPKFSESVLDIRVYYEDTDAGGVVFYANYLKFLERARTEWLRGLGVNQSDLAEREHRLFGVHSLDMSYRKPARLDDLITIRSRITRIGRASIHFAQRAERNGELLAQGNI